MALNTKPVNARPASKVALWKRPRLPDAHDGSSGIVTGCLALGFGVILILAGASAYDGGFELYLWGGGLIQLGLTIVVVSLILREIRYVAFEAAVRAGEYKPAEREAPAHGGRPDQ